MELATLPERKFAHVRRALLTMAFGALTACGDDGFATSPQMAQLDRAETLWHNVSGSGFYTMEQRFSCECLNAGRRFLVKVENNVIVSVQDIDWAVSLPASQFSQFLTVPQLFERIRRTLGLDGSKVSVTYNAGAGYPMVVSLDPYPGLVDDEVTITTSSLATRLD